MNIKLLTQKQLQALNNLSLKYPLHIAEKDYFLAVVSGIIYDSPLKEKIIFKGGTALHHCYLPQLRFSEDLDFSANDKSIAFEDFQKVLESYKFLSIKKHFISKATIKLEKVKYEGLLETPGSLKVETDFIQNVLLPPVDLPYSNPWGIETKVRVMDIKEICAEKIRAASDRVRYRDFYDLYMIFYNFKFDLKEIIELVKQKEVREIISKESILANWELAKDDKKNELSSIYYSQPVEDEDIEKMLRGFEFTAITK